MKIVTNLQWPSFRNVANDIRRQLARRCSCSVFDWSRVRPGGKTIAIGTVDHPTLQHIKRLTPESDVIFYATTEGLSRLDPADLQIAEHTKIVTVSKFVREMLEEIRVPVEGVVHHGIDMKDRSVDAKFCHKLGTRFKDRKVILTVSANHSRKGLDRLLSAYRLVEKHNSSAFLILHSQRKGSYDLEKRARNLEINGLWLTNRFGSSTKARLNALYRFCTVYVQPSLSEGFGLPVLEAFRFNKPTIAVDAPPFNEVIKHEETGILLPLRGVSWSSEKGPINFKTHEYSGDDLAQAIERLISNRSLMQKLQHRIASEKWKWDASKLYPDLLTYFG